MTEERAAKQPKLDPDVAANVILQFESAEGEQAGIIDHCKHARPVITTGAACCGNCGFLAPGQWLNQ